MCAVTASIQPEIALWAFHWTSRNGGQAVGCQRPGEGNLCTAQWTPQAIGALKSQELGLLREQQCLFWGGHCFDPRFPPISTRRNCPKQRPHQSAHRSKAEATSIKPDTPGPEKENAQDDQNNGKPQIATQGQAIPPTDGLLLTTSLVCAPRYSVGRSIGMMVASSDSTIIASIFPLDISCSEA